MFVTILYLRKGFGRSFFSFLFFQIPSNSNLNNLKGILLPRNSDSKFELRNILCVDSEDRSQGDGFRQHDIKSIASFENHSDVNGFFIESRGSSVSCYKSVLYMAAPSMSLSEVSSLQALTERVEKPSIQYSLAGVPLLFSFYMCLWKGNRFQNQSCQNLSQNPRGMVFRKSFSLSSSSALL